MKKYLLHAIIPVAGLLSVTLSLSSCSKSDDNKVITDPPMGTTPQILYRKSVNNSDANELWSIKADGTSDHKINVALPTGWTLMDEDMTEVAPDEKTMVVLAYNETTDRYAIYKCNIDGSNVTLVVASTSESEGDYGIQGYIDQSSILYWKDANTLYGKELWRVNIDGSNNAKVNIVLPSGTFFGDEELAKITSDGKTIVFLVEDDNNSNAASIYKCNIDGSNVSQVSPADGGANTSLAIQSLVSDKTVLYRKNYYIDSQIGQQDFNELWEVDLNGANKHQVNITLPSGVFLQNEEMAKSFGSGQGLIFSTTTESRENNYNGVEAIYVSAIDGSKPTLIKQLSAGEDIAIQAVIE